MELFDAVSSLPHLDPSVTGGSLSLAPALADPTKRPWETSKTGYQNWAVAELIQRAKELRSAGKEGGMPSTAVENIADQAYAVADAEGVQGALNEVREEVSRGRDDDAGERRADEMDVS